MNRLANHLCAYKYAYPIRNDVLWWWTWDDIKASSRSLALWNGFAREEIIIYKQIWRKLLLQHIKRWRFASTTHKKMEMWHKMMLHGRIGNTTSCARNLVTCNRTRVFNSASNLKLATPTRRIPFSRPVQHHHRPSLGQHLPSRVLWFHAIPLRWLLCANNWQETDAFSSHHWRPGNHDRRAVELKIASSKITLYARNSKISHFSRVQ